MANRFQISYLGSPTAYAFGGGTTRGAEAFRMRQPTEVERTAGIMGSIPTFREEFRPRTNRFGQSVGGGIEVLPTGSTLAQRQAATERGNLATEAPRQFQLQRDNRGAARYVDPRTGQSMGSVMWVGGGYGGMGGENTTQRSWSNYTGSNPINSMVGSGFYENSRMYGNGGSMVSGGPQPEASSTMPAPVIPERSLGMTAQSPVAFTGFGRASGEAPSVTPTIPEEVRSPFSTTIPRFPFGGMY